MDLNNVSLTYGPRETEWLNTDTEDQTNSIVTYGPLHH